MKKKFFWLTAILLAVFLSGCDQKIYTSKKIENPGQETPKPNNPQPNPNPTPSTKYKVTITQPANGKIEVTPALPTDGTVDKGRELTFTLSANSGYKVKALTINGTTYSDVTDNSITKKIKIEKNTAVSGTAEAETNPEPSGTETFSDTQGNSVKIKPNKDYNGEIIDYSLEGEIYIEDILSEAFKAKLADLNGKDLNTSDLNINCFFKKTEGSLTQSTITTRNNNTPVTYETKEITSDLLEQIFNKGTKYNFSNFKLNNTSPDGHVEEVLFKDEVSKYYDITTLAKFSFNDKFKLKEGSKILLKGNRETNMVGGVEDHTEYPKVNELLHLINNPKLKDKIVVGSVQLAGNVKDLLPYLVPGPNKITEKDGEMIIFGNANKIPCEGELWTGFNGYIDDTKKQSILKVNELQELCKRTIDKQIYIRNAVIQDLNSTNMNIEDLKNTTFFKSKLANVSFKSSNLSKITMEKAQVQGELRFEDSTLPQTMENAVIDHLILKNTILPKDLYDCLPSFTPDLKDSSLKIYNKNKDEILGQYDNNIWPAVSSPKKYIEPKNVWDILKLAYPHGNTKTKYTQDGEDLTDTPLDQINFSSIQKIKDQYLALIQNQGRSRG